ncbi:glutathione-specific gamma-glutamylcyclotransferase 1 [Thrips palmi]|uniref:glutathione-specific gamma-glutamylcyclotransferase n=1 Tax=Thrips palmi TaxID=161013 RepID=A0A6P8ZTB4_THRPL|nr:glutathione-specific gamma-glutamylcyclotransferase 1 [Thrips palmi]
MNAEHAAHAAGDADSAATSGLWVFGYGSLCWHPGFDFHRSVTGYIKGYARKFWQGNTTHRGTENQPGRVATLVEEKDGVVWGRAFELSGEAALPYLANRECKLGGYITNFATFFPKRPCLDDAGVGGGVPGGVPVQPFAALLYVATPSNRLWLGDAPLPLMAHQIVECRGATGHNVEYLLRLAEYMRHAAPEADDDHLFSLEQLVRHEIRRRRLCLDTLMGVASAATSKATPTTVLGDDDDDDVVVAAAVAAAAAAEQDDKGDVADVAELAVQLQHQHLEQAAAAQDAFAFSSRVPGKKLRCINIS